MQPDLNLRRQLLAARSSQMVAAKPLGQLKKTGVMASFVTLARHDRYQPCGLKGTVWDGDLVTVLDWRGLSTTGL